MALIKQMSKLHKLAELKEKEKEEIQYGKYKHLFDIAIKIIKKHRVLLYGGTALNELMPPSMRFYGPFTLPDVDVFTVNAKQLASQVVDTFKRMGYNIPMFSEALHPNTYKVYVEGLQLLDISDVSEATFKKLSRGGIKTSIGLKTVNPDFLRMSLHLMLSHPFDAQRWTKVFERLTYFYKLYPYDKCPTLDAIKPQRIRAPRELVDEFVAFVELNGFISFGGSEVAKYMSRDDKDDNPHALAYDILVASDVEHVATSFVKIVDDPDLALTPVYEGDFIVPRHMFITYKGKRIFGLYESTSCTSYVTLNGIRVASFHAMCQLYMCLLFSPYRHHSKQRIKCIVTFLTKLQHALFTKPSSKKLLTQFVLDCNGPYEGQATLKRKQIQRRIV